MIKLSMEVPLQLLGMIEPHLDSHFVIASYAKRCPEYLEYYRKVEDKPIILDNGMYEDGYPLDAYDLFDIAQEINPEVVLAPDHLRLCNDTLTSSIEFFSLCKRKKAPWRIGWIPQGRDADEIAYCLNLMLSWDKSELPFVGISFLNNRKEVIDLFHTIGLFSRKIEWHMLGLCNLEEIKTWPACIASMDTVKPIKAAFQNEKIEEMTRGRGKWRLDWSLSEEQKELALRNTLVLKEALRL